MPFLSAEGLSLVDIAMLAIIIIGLPVEALRTLKQDREELASGKPDARIKHYTWTLLMLWGLALPIIVLWATSGRDWAELGFQIELGKLAIAGWTLAGFVAIFFTYQYVLVARSESVRKQFRDQLSGNPIMSNFMPKTDAERGLFNALGISAGIAEEIIFRGYLIWALNLFMPLWIAATAALLVFTLLHLYQGAKQLPPIFVIGALATLVFVLSGSLWPAIALHIFVDVINNQTVWKARMTPA